MNLDQIRHSFETLQHLQPPLLRKIPPLCRAIEEGQLDNTEYVKPVSNGLPLKPLWPRLCRSQMPPN